MPSDDGDSDDEDDEGEYNHDDCVNYFESGLTARTPGSVI